MAFYDANGNDLTAVINTDIDSKGRKIVDYIDHRANDIIKAAIANDYNIAFATIKENVDYYVNKRVDAKGKRIIYPKAYRSAAYSDGRNDFNEAVEIYSGH